MIRWPAIDSKGDPEPQPDGPALIVRDLRGGRDFRFDLGSMPPQRVLAMQTTMPWSPDGRYGDAAAVLGWQYTDNTMIGIPLFPGASPEVPTAQVIAVELDGLPDGALDIVGGGPLVERHNRVARWHPSGWGRHVELSGCLWGQVQGRGG